MYNQRKKEVISRLKDTLDRLSMNKLSELDLNSILYVAYLEKMTNKSLDDLEDLDLKFHTKLIYSKYDNQIKELSKLFSTDDLKELLLSNDKEELVNEKLELRFLNDGIYKLIIDLLEIEKNDKIGDFQLNSFSNFEYIIENKNYNLIDIYESDMQKALIYKMRNDVLEGDAKIIESNILDENIDKKYTKILSPMRFQTQISEKQKFILSEKYPQIENRYNRSVGWADILSSLLYLDENGKLISLTLSLAMYSSLEKNIRQYFVENGLIESVISLPRNLLNGTGIESTILVISKNNTSINFVDAKDVYTSVNRVEKDLYQENREDILNLIGKKSNNSRVVSVEEVKEKDYILDPKRYLTEISFKEEVLLGNIAMISRGSNITNKEMERYKSDQKTKYRFLNLVDIQAGRIKDTAISLKESLVESNSRLDQKNKLEKGQLLLSRTGNPIRIAIVEDIEDEVWFYSGNIYSISLDPNKYNPYYLKIFLESELGQKVLDQISLGSAIPNISMKDLNEIKLPYVDIEKQNKIADLYLNYEKKIREKEKELESLKLNRQRDLADIVSREEIGLCN
ncbi:N-6 DNA methylase [Peptoniphilus stercorisuis]|uniref:Type I restriction enzyme M protein n=1 Tax=Peptoniphilus stercorisuis TaxID=1436965 RepID=A0ABS4KEB2_9FIRM|nr:N-6 DNA methylase [Peptoniphilus stercorisuis]MBP2026103.1 type I restriction enzyme M protein [Peptoniphilus stercorisuis]